MSISSVTQQAVNTSPGVVINASKLPTQSASGTSVQSPAQSAPPASQPPTKTVEQLNADKQNLFNLADQLRQLTSPNDGKPLTALQISSALKSQIDVPFTGSTYALGRSTPPTLATVITDLGFELPSSVDQVSALANKIEQKASTPPLGNLGGALSWPTPMSQEDQQRIREFLLSDSSGVPGLPLPKHGNGVLHYLLHGSSVTHSDLQDPRLALQKLLDSPKAQALGQALQAHLKGVPTDISIYDYLLTAINIGLDPDSIWASERNTIARSHLDDRSHWGLAPAEVVDCLGKALVKEGRASHASVKLTTHLLLSRSAPQYLIKDIPKNVTIGSIPWTQLTIAAAKIEAQTPGRVPGMTYAEVIVAAQSLPTDSVDVQSAEREALKDWGVAKGLLKPIETNWVVDADKRLVPKQTEPSEPEIEQVRQIYNLRLNELTKASSQMQTPIPMLKDIALDSLKAEFPNLDPSVFEAKVLKRYYSAHGLREYVDENRSMLDIAMEGEKPAGKMKWFTDDSRIPMGAFNRYIQSDRLNAPKVFADQYSAAIKAQGEGHHNMVKYLASNLPLEDQKNIEYGKREVFRIDEYEPVHEVSRSDKLVKRATTLVYKTTRNGVVDVYNFDTANGTVKKEHYWLAKTNPPYTGSKMDLPEANRIRRATLIEHEGANPDFYTKERPVNPEIPNTYNSRRTSNLADAFVKMLDLKDPALLNEAKSGSSFHEERTSAEALRQFVLNLVPFRSAIVNFRDGNTGAGVLDLALDVFGLITLGAGKAAQAVKVLGKGAISTSKAVKFLGTTAIDALNPIPTGLLASVGKLGVKAFKKGAEVVNTLKGASGSYDLLKAASKNHGVVATGTYKVAENTFEGAAVLKDGKWYAYSPSTDRAYGTKPLTLFTPNSIAMGGVIQEFKILGTGLAMYEDQTKRGLRLTLDAHGVIKDGDRSAYMTVNGEHIIPSELLELLRVQGVKLDKYAEIRLTMCHSANGGNWSFAAQFARLTHKPVEGFMGKMNIDSSVGDEVAARAFTNKALLQDHIDNTVIGVRKHQPVKYDETGKTEDGRIIYTHSREYNPVRFDANGAPLPPKPTRPGYIDTFASPKYEPSEKPTDHSDVDFEGYEDLT